MNILGTNRLLFMIIGVRMVMLLWYHVDKIYELRLAIDYMKIKIIWGKGVIQSFFEHRVRYTRNLYRARVRETAANTMNVFGYYRRFFSLNVCVCHINVLCMRNFYSY